MENELVIDIAGISAVIVACCSAAFLFIFLVDKITERRKNKRRYNPADACCVEPKRKHKK